MALGTVVSTTSLGASRVGVRAEGEQAGGVRVDASHSELRTDASQSEQLDRQERKAEIRKTKTKYGGGYFVKLMLKLKMAKLHSHIGCCVVKP